MEEAALKAAPAILPAVQYSALAVLGLGLILAFVLMVLSNRGQARTQSEVVDVLRDLANSVKTSVQTAGAQVIAHEGSEAERHANHEAAELKRHAETLAAVTDVRERLSDQVGELKSRVDVAIARSEGREAAEAPDQRRTMPLAVGKVG